MFTLSCWYLVLFVLGLPFSSVSFSPSRRLRKAGHASHWLEEIARTKHAEVRSHINKKKYVPSREKYHFGDYTRSFLRYSRATVLVLIVRVVLDFRLEKLVLRRIPEHVLLDILNMCLYENVRPRVLRVVAFELDKRLHHFFKEHCGFGEYTRRAVQKFTGNKEYQFGDLTKKVLEEARHRSTDSTRLIQKEIDDFLVWRENYHFGDISRGVVRKITRNENFDFPILSVPSKLPDILYPFKEKLTEWKIYKY